MGDMEEGTPLGQVSQPDSGTAAQQQTTAEGTQGQAQGQPGTAETTTTGASGTSDDSFFDPRSIADKPELQAAYKQMQAAFTRKMQGIKGTAQKVQAYDEFMRDPVTQMQNMALRMGYRLTRAEVAQMASDQQAAGTSGSAREPQTWDDVYQTAEQRAVSKIKEQLAPVLSHVQEMRRSNIEKMLNDNCPDWRTYESDMMDVLQAHPTLISDPIKLYRLSIPPEVLESKAMQRALERLQNKGGAAATAGAAQTKHKTASGVTPDKPVTFSEAVEFARQKLAEQGLAMPKH